VDGGLCCSVPARPERATHRIRFVFLRPHLRSKLPSDPASRRHPCASLVLRLHAHLDRGLAPPSTTICPAHTGGAESRAAVGASAPGLLSVDCAAFSVLYTPGRELSGHAGPCPCSARVSTPTPVMLAHSASMPRGCGRSSTTPQGLPRHRLPPPSGRVLGGDFSGPIPEVLLARVARTHMLGMCAEIRWH
jgi:hypothetical protein